jgi:glycosyltransferase involved in cell wall biosynthesis
MSEKPCILFVGGFEPRKGLENLLLALEIVHRTLPNATLRVIAKTGFRGVDTEEWFEMLADRARVSHSVEFRQSVEESELLQFYSDADVVVLPSRNEGWGLSLMEAMACRKPVVATRVGGIPELVRDGVDGTLVEPGDVAGLAAAMVAMLSDDKLRSRMGSSGRERVSAFTWAEAARVTLAAYRRLA